MANDVLVAEEISRDQRGRFASKGGASPSASVRRDEPKDAPKPDAAKPAGRGFRPGQYRNVLPEHGRAIFRRAGQRVGRQSEQGMIDVGRKLPAGMRSARLVVAEAVPSSGVPQVQRAELRGEDHTDRIPAKSFSNDLKRKLKLRGVMGRREDEELPSEGMKFTKEDANYRYAADPKRSCDDCVYFVDDGSCEIVAGLIRRVDTCDHFKADESGRVRATLMGLAEVTPVGYEKIVRGLKKKGDVDNPYAVAWWMKGQGIKPKQSEEGGPGSGPQGGVGSGVPASLRPRALAALKQRRQAVKSLAHVVSRFEDFAKRAGEPPRLSPTSVRASVSESVFDVVRRIRL